MSNWEGPSRDQRRSASAAETKADPAAEGESGRTAGWPGLVVDGWWLISI